MTNEEAIEQINIIKSFTGFDENNQMVIRLHKAFDKAVKLLKSQPCEDCISRAYIEPIVEELENICINGDEQVLSMLADIKNAPSVTPKRPHGHWEVVGKEKSKCDKCGATVIILTPDIETEANFCPNCGADMRAEWKGHEVN